MREDFYTTKNLNIAAFLYSCGIKLISTENINAEVFFNFKPKEKAEKLVESYFAGTATVNPRELFARLNDLRDLIFSGSKTNNYKRQNG